MYHQYLLLSKCFPQVAVMRGLLPGQPPPVFLLTSGKLGTLIKTINPNSFFHSCAPVHFLLHTSSSCKLRLEFRAELQAEFRAELEDRSGRMAFQLQHVRSCVPRDRHVLSTAISKYYLDIKPRLLLPVPAL